MSATRRERPILFSAPMVQALLAGRKTVTRRLVTEHVHARADSFLVRRDGGLEVLVGGRSVGDLRNRFGLPGDQLWVRETWRAEETGFTRNLYYRADEEWHEGAGWKPSIHMPRWASRLTLEVVSARVERLHAITEEDARNEGVLPVDDPFGEDTEYWECHECECAGVLSARESFATLWGSINGAASWDANPWVWRVEFKRVGAAT